MFVDHGKNMGNQMQQMIEKALTKSFKSLNISYDSHVAHANQLASNSSGTHVPLEKISNLACH
jgi:hypothetical protein